MDTKTMTRDDFGIVAVRHSVMSDEHWESHKRATVRGMAQKLAELTSENSVSIMGVERIDSPERLEVRAWIERKGKE
jgi:hypothetical protein